MPNRLVAKYKLTRYEMCLWMLAMTFHRLELKRYKEHDQLNTLKAKYLQIARQQITKKKCKEKKIKKRSQLNKRENSDSRNMDIPNLYERQMTWDTS